MIFYELFFIPPQHGLAAEPEFSYWCPYKFLYSVFADVPPPTVLASSEPSFLTHYSLTLSLHYTRRLLYL